MRRAALGERVQCLVRAVRRCVVDAPHAAPQHRTQPKTPTNVGVGGCAAPHRRTRRDHDADIVAGTVDTNTAPTDACVSCRATQAILADIAPSPVSQCTTARRSRHTGTGGWVSPRPAWRRDGDLIPIVDIPSK